MTGRQIGKIMRSHKFTRAEKQLLECQYPEQCHPGNFTAKLFEAIHAADEHNRDLLAMGFELQVAAVRSWTLGNLRERMEAEADEAA